MTLKIKHKKFTSIINLALIGLIILTTGFGCKLTSQETKERLQPITLNYWRVWDDREDFQDIINAYRQLHPNITINYRHFRYDEYERALLEAFAEDRGPDIFAVHESWLKKYQPRLTPMPSQITMAYQVIKGGLKQEVVPELRTTPTPNDRELKNMFAETAYRDMMINGKVYGLPLSLETLIMFYNRDILNRSSIIEPAKSWDAFQVQVAQTTRFDTTGNIRQSGTAMGTGKNIERSPDILSLLMMQVGATMTNANGYPTFFDTDSSGRSRGVEALNFYTDFANPVKEVYSWDKDMPNSLNAFTQGSVAFMFGYNYHLPTIRSRAPRLNLGIAPVPQVSQEYSKNYANYWLEVVAAKSKHPNEAWDFIIFSTTKPEQNKKYLNKTGKPAALLSLLSDQLNSEDLNAGASQVLTADNWYQGKNPIAAETAIIQLLDDFIDATTLEQQQNIIRNTIQKINQTIQ